MSSPDFTDPSPAEEPIGVTLENLDLDPIFRNKRLRGLALEGSTLNPGLTRTVEGASTLTVPVQDPDWGLLDSGLFDTRLSGQLKTPVEISLGALWFRLVRIVPQPAQLQLVFQDREVALLQEATKKVPPVSRSKITLAEFAYRLIRSVPDERNRLRAFVPELHDTQAIAKPEGASKRAQRDAARKKGLPSGLQLQQWDGGTHTLTSTETHDAEKALEASEGAPQKAILALLEACIVEGPMFDNPTKSDGTSVGILSLTNEHLGGSSSTKGGRRDIEKVCQLFLTEGFAGAGGAIALSRQHPDWTPGKIAQECQGSAFPERYDKVQSSAQRVLSAWTGGGGRKDGSNDPTVVKPYLFKVTGNYWQTLTNYAQPINWRIFCVNGVVYFISEERLFESRPRFTLTRDHPAVVEVTFSEWDARKELAEFTFTSHADIWTVPQGCVVTWGGGGPFKGGWLVHQIEQPDLGEKLITVTLNRPILKGEEPAPETESGTSSFAGTNEITVGSGTDGRIKAGLKKAQEIDKRNYRYVYGGGHATFDGPYDCSGLQSAILHAMGLLDSPEATSDLINWGKPGEGQIFTLWVHETGDEHTSHTFSTFKVNEKTLYVEAGGAESEHTGFHKPRSTAGFTPRHWPGL